MADRRGELLDKLKEAHYWLEERGGVYDITESQALKALYKLGEMMSILERRKNK